MIDMLQQNSDLFCLQVNHQKILIDRLFIYTDTLPQWIWISIELDNWLILEVLDQAIHHIHYRNEGKGCHIILALLANIKYIANRTRYMEHSVDTFNQMLHHEYHIIMIL